MNKDFQVKHLAKGDLDLFRQLIQVFNIVFETGSETECSAGYLQTLLEKSGFHIFCLMHNGQVAGGLTAFELPMYTAEGSELLLYDIAVMTHHQRKGGGKLLLTALQNYCREEEIQFLFVQANEEDIHALDFYRSAGWKAEKVVNFNYAPD